MHDQPLEKALLGFEGNIPHIRGFDMHLVITKLQVNLANIFGPLKLVQNLINLRDWVPIPDNELF